MSGPESALRHAYLGTLLTFMETALYNVWMHSNVIHYRAMFLHSPLRLRICCYFYCADQCIHFYSLSTDQSAVCCCTCTLMPLATHLRSNKTNRIWPTMPMTFENCHQNSGLVFK